MTGFIYLISCLDRTKVGFSTNPMRRMASIGTATPYPCTPHGYVPGAVVHEKAIHRALADWRRNGEWFDPCDKLARLTWAVAHDRVLTGEQCVDLVGGSHQPDPASGTFDDLLSLWASPKELSLALDVPYVNAQAMKRRKTVGVDHWPKLIELAAQRGVRITVDDLLKMKVAA